MKPHPFLFPIPDLKFYQVCSNSVSPLTGTAVELVGEASLSDSAEPSQRIRNLIPNVCSYPQKSRHAGESGTVSSVNVCFLGSGTAVRYLNMENSPQFPQIFKIRINCNQWKRWCLNMWTISHWFHGSCTFTSINSSVKLRPFHANIVSNAECIQNDFLSSRLLLKKKDNPTHIFKSQTKLGNKNGFF